jgi:hypothetical protein
MGAATSVVANRAAGDFLKNEKLRPIDASDILDGEAAMAEVKRMRAKLATITHSEEQREEKKVGAIGNHNRRMDMNK